MTPSAIRGRRAVRLAALLVLAVLIGGCVNDATAIGSFDPASACNGVDSQAMAGAYPELEALLPKSLVGVAPTSLVSGRLCSANTLGTLYGHGIHETHFASAVWNRGGGSGIQMTVNGLAGMRLDIANDDYAQQVVVWPGGAAGRVRVVITSNIHEPDLQVALSTFN
jgi:hypothetical protein